MTTYSAVAVRKSSWQYGVLKRVHREDMLPKTRCGVWASIVFLPPAYLFLQLIGVALSFGLIALGTGGVMELGEVSRWSDARVDGEWFFLASLLIGTGTALAGWLTYRVAWRQWPIAAALGLLACWAGISIFQKPDSLQDFFFGIWFTSYGALLTVYAVTFATQQWWLPPLIQFYHWICRPVEYTD